MLSESELTFKKAFEIAQGKKAAHRYVSDLGDQNLASDGKGDMWYTSRSDGKEDMWYTSRSVGKDQKNRRQPWSVSCYRCEENHKPEECPHKRKKCYRCLKTGHLIRCCHSKLLNQSDRSSPNERRYTQPNAESRYKPTHHVATTNSESDMERPKMYNMFRIDEKAGKSKPYQTKILINGNEINVEIDT